MNNTNNIKWTKSLCPECLSILDAKIFEEDNNIKIEKVCKEHGTFSDIYWSSIEYYNKFSKYMHNGNGIKNPNIVSEKECPNNCGICHNHKTSTILANIDVTNRCDQKCKICFANSANNGYIYQPSISQIRDMMVMLRNELPVPCPGIQFSGGEPTIRDDIIDLVKMAKDFEFSHIQMATNGVRIAKDIEFCQDLKNAGIHTLYLQFDGISETPYIKNRGYNALPLKLKAIENCRKIGLNSVNLVPTLAKGVNDDQVGDIIRFAINNNDVIKGVNFQPISFSGRINSQNGSSNHHNDIMTSEERMQKRITIPDLFKLIEEQTDNLITGEDFFPVPSTVSASQFLSVQNNKAYTEFSVHPHCGAGTFVYKENGKIIPITRFVDAEGLFEYLKELSQENYKFGGETLSKLTEPIQLKLKKLRRFAKLTLNISKFIDEAKLPKSLNIEDIIVDILGSGTKDTLAKLHNNTTFIGVMHFMDSYNFDVERVKRCGIHYATPDGRIIPFCTYNSLYREKIERQFATCS